MPLLWSLACAPPDEVDSRRAALSGISVLTRNYNPARTGANLDEHELTTANVSTATFGKLFNLSVDDDVYAGVLYAANLSIAGGSHNVLYVATVNNSVYAFDADTGGSPLWQANFNNGFRPLFHLEVGCYPYRDFSGNIGIVGTPVIDAGTGRMFLVSRTVEDGVFRQRLRALDIVTGNEVLPPRELGTINPKTNNQRASLALSQGKVYVSWASHCDAGPYRGFVIAYNTSDLSEAATFNAAGTGNMVGVWMGGAAPIVDSSGNLIYATGNGSSNPASGQYGEAIVKLSPSLTPLDYFIPANFGALNAVDNDLGSSGPINLPGTNLIVLGGKDSGTCYLVDMTNMGHTVAGDTQIRQKWHCGDPDNLSVGATHHFHNAMVAWNSPAGLTLYTWAENDFGRAWRFNGSTLDLPAVSISESIPPLGMPGGMMSISANGSTPGTGVLWASMPLSGDANQNTVPGILRAFDAEDLTRELWNSATIPYDTINNFSKGAPPVIANGKVYVASHSGIVSVFGLRAGPTHPDITQGGTVSATGTPCNPVTEGPNAAYDDALKTKWCVTAAPSTSTPIAALYDFAGTDSYIVDSYTITTANDASLRDPLDWRFEGCQGTCTAASDTGWVTLDTRAGEFFHAGRFQSTFYAFSNSLGYQQYRLRFTANHGDPTRFQIAEVQLFGTAGVCALESDPAFCARLGKNCGAVMAVDNCGNPRTVDPCGTCTPPGTCGGGGVANVCGSPCAPESDPAFCARLGKNCGMVTGTDNCGAPRSVGSCGTCTAPLTCGGGGTANVCSTSGPVPDLTEGGTATSTGTACNASQTVAAAYDNMLTPSSFTKWCVTSAPSTSAPLSAAYRFAGTSAFIVTGYSVTSGDDVPDRDPRDWALEGCQGSCTVASDAGWVTLDVRTGQFFGAQRYQTNTYPVANANAFRQYRLRVTSNNGAAQRMQLAEVQLFGDPGVCLAESDAGFCARLGKNCGAVSGTDDCGAPRTVGSCGTCTPPDSCGGAGVANICAPPRPPEVTSNGTAAATGAACNSAESAGMAYDDLMTSAEFSKWCVTSAPSAAVPVSTVYAFAGADSYVVTSYAVTTANDVPERDPRDWTFQGCAGTCTVGSDSGWVTLDGRSGQFAGAGRYQTIGYPVANSAGYQQYRLRITANNGASNRLQLAEVQMFGTPGACSPESDPGFCARLGKDCGAVTGTDNCGSPRTVASCGTCAAPATCGGGGTANVCGATSADVTEGGLASGTGTACNGSESVARAYDNASSGASFTKWCVTSAPSAATPISTVYDFAGGNTFAVSSYAITTGNDAPERDPSSWSFQGCSSSCAAGSDTGWTTLDTRTSEFAGAARFQTNTYAVASASAYQQYRLRVTAGRGSPDRFQISELQMFGAAGPCLPESNAAFCARLGKSCDTVSGTDDCGSPRTVSSCGTCTAPDTCGGSGTANVCGSPEVTEGGTPSGTGTACNSSTENVSKVYDNLMTSASFTKWCVTAAPSATTPISTVYDFAGSTAYTVTSYAVTTANDFPERDPRSWTLEGCQGTCTAASDTGWITVDTRTGQFTGAGRFQTNLYAVASPAAYQQYRLRITANNGGSNRLQVGEVQLFGN